MIMEKFDLTDRVAVVTGAGRGLGRAMSLALADAGAHIVCSARTREQIEETAALIKEKGRRTLVVPTDVTDSHQVNAMVDAAIAEFGRIDILLNNAGGGGAGAGKTLPELTDDEWRSGMDTNISSMFYCTRAVVPHMQKQGGGVVVSITSGFGLRGSRNNYMYASAKAAMINITRSLALTYSRDNIRFNCIAPGVFPLTERAMQTFRGGMYIPMGRPGQAWELGPLCVFLCSDAASYISGITIVLDGGGMAGGQFPTGFAPVIPLKGGA